ncbi:MAG: trypsin-like peptidase domain-containing protein [Cyanobacteria bacterium J06626_18]
MEERLTFSVKDYGRAVARLMQGDGLAVGAGFLVAPGYVMTCAHVVLQALGVDHPEFQLEQYRVAPVETVQLDFPLATVDSVPITARVVEWLPYSDNRDDIAVLKLEGDVPIHIRPIPFATIEFETSFQDNFEVYGFPVQAGDWVKSYQPERPVDDGRLLLKKQDASEFDVIESGYSGAPMWNKNKGCVVGMVATVQIETARKAYAISRTKLENTLKKVDAYDLHDTLQRSVADCADADRTLYERAISKVFERCNPNECDRPWQEQLSSLASDRPLPNGWDIATPLTYFAVMLAWMEGTPTSAYQLLKAWVERREPDFSALLEQLTREMKQKKVTASTVCEHLMVTVERVETSDTDLQVSLWPIFDRATYSPQAPPQPLVQDHVIALSQLPEFIQRQCRNRFGKKTVPVIHLFVPRDLLGCDVEMQPIGKLKERLGSTFPFVMRTNLAVHPVGAWYWDDWREKWQAIQAALERKTADVFDAVDCAALEAGEDALIDLMDTLAEQHAALLSNCASVEDLFELLADEKDSALPIALWSRQPELEAEVPKVLDCVMRTLKERIRQERGAAKRGRDKMLLGHHLTLVWEDPKIVPPDVQFKS